MTFSRLADRTTSTHQRSSRQGTKIDRFIVHHAASTSHAAVVRMMTSGSREVSANYVVSDVIEGVVPEQYAAWTSGAGRWDRRAITVETINDRGEPRWTVSDRTFDNLARLIADCAHRHGFPITDDTVLTHQELYRRYGDSYATACPGDLQRRKGELLALANHYLRDATSQEGKIMIIQVKGRTGVRRGGLYILDDGKASFIGHDPAAKNVPLIESESVIAALGRLYKGLA